ncbi:MAG TPA: mandelate racemase/muconate lactonizing enzyme family protein [Dehalococcoidia bacterium]
MKITKIECIPFLVPSRRAGGAPGPGLRYESLLLKMHTDEGIVGIGETGETPLWYTGDSVESVIGFVRQTEKILIGADPFERERLVAQLDRAAKYSNQALAVVDCALHDIVGKKLGVPAYQILGGLSNPKIPLGWVIGSGPHSTPEDAALRAAEAAAEGFRSIKLKVSRRPVEHDIATIRAIRDAVGYDVRLGIDANGGWDYFEALSALRRMEKYDIFMCEQPTPWREIDNLARLRQKVGIPICADESATELSHVLQIIQRDAADILFIKLAKAGGIIQAQKWVAIAKAAGLPVMCGCMAGTGLESAWQAHFLAADEWMGRIEQENLGVLIVNGRLETVKTPVTDDLVKNVPRVEDGCMYPPDGPGLGVELNEDVLAGFMTTGKAPVTVGA